MQHHSIVILLVVLAICGCSSSSQPTEGRLLGAAINPSVTSPASLDGGGRWFAGQDTGTWYDLSLILDLQSSVPETRPINYTLELGYFVNGQFKPGGGTLFFDGDSVVRNAVPFQVAGSAHTTLSIQGTVGIGRHLNDWSVPYGYRLTLRDISTGDSAVRIDSLRGSYASNRFRGVIRTTEASPDSLGLIDGPDDGDCALVGGVRQLEPCFPDPASGNSPSTTTTFNLRSPRDSVRLTLNKTPRGELLRKLDEQIQTTGGFEVVMQLDWLQAGQYRVYLRIVDSGRVSLTHTDLMITK